MAASRGDPLDRPRIAARFRRRIPGVHRAGSISVLLELCGSHERAHAWRRGDGLGGRLLDQPLPPRRRIRAGGAGSGADAHERRRLCNHRCERRYGARDRGCAARHPHEFLDAHNPHRDDERYAGCLQERKGCAFASLRSARIRHERDDACPGLAISIRRGRSDAYFGHGHRHRPLCSVAVYYRRVRRGVLHGGRHERRGGAAALFVDVRRRRRSQAFQRRGLPGGLRRRGRHGPARHRQPRARPWRSCEVERRVQDGGRSGSAHLLRERLIRRGLEPERGTRIHSQRNRLRAEVRPKRRPVLRAVCARRVQQRREGRDEGVRRPAHQRGVLVVLERRHGGEPPGGAASARLHRRLLQHEELLPRGVHGIRRIRHLLRPPQQDVGAPRRHDVAVQPLSGPGRLLVPVAEETARGRHARRLAFVPWNRRPDRGQRAERCPGTLEVARRLAGGRQDTDDAHRADAHDC